MSLEDLERRVRTLEDVEEIKNLVALYCRHCDNNFDADAIADLFTEDAVRAGGEWGQYKGREEIRNWYGKLSREAPFTVHMFMNPIIQVDGDTAKGTWYMFAAGTMAVEEDRAFWAAAWCEDEYARVNGQWKFKRKNVTHSFNTPFDEGWAKNRMWVPYPGPTVSRDE